MSGTTGWTKSDRLARGLLGLGLGVATLVLPFLPWVAALAAPLVALDGSLGLSPLAMTHYAPGYSHWAFITLREGMSRSEVVARVGLPLGERWTYVGRDPSATKLIDFDAARRVARADPVYPGWSAEEIERAEGRPDRVHLLYSYRTVDTSYRVRYVTLQDDRVVGVRSYYYVD